MLIVLPFVLIDTSPVALRLEVAGPRIDSVPDWPLSDCDRLIGPEPTMMYRPLDTVPVVPAVLPSVDMPSDTTPSPAPPPEER